MMMKKLVVLFSGILLAVACGDDATKSSGNTSSNNTVAANNTSGEMLVKPGTTEACGLDGRVGDTECLQAGLSCQAGQYCNTEELTCSVGCISDNNCASNQFCDLTMGSPGTCLNCVIYTPTQSGNNTANNTANNTSTNTANNTSTGISAACETIIDAGVTCELLPANQAAAAKTACSAEAAADVNLLLTCVNAAAGDCAQISECVGSDMPMETGCETDSQCNASVGESHEICSGGSCQFGCRLNEECGQDFICDLELGPGTAGACVPDF